jgi:hypothetical protein
MGGCISRQRAEYDPSAPLVGGGSAVVGLVPALRRLVQRGTVQFSSLQSRRSGTYDLRLVPPFSIEGGSLLGAVKLYRDQEQEGREVLVFRGECSRGFKYRVKVTVHLCQQQAVRHRMELSWTKRAENTDDYTIEYELILYR